MDLNFKQELYSDQIVNILKYMGIKINGVYARDELTNKKLRNGGYIINLDSHNGKGTHWCGFYKSGKTVYYFDSFGFEPPQEEMNLFLKDNTKIFYNDLQIQNVKSILCGFFVIAFFIAIKYFQGSLAYRINNFQMLFNDNTKNNDKVLKKFILSYYYKDINA